MNYIYIEKSHRHRQKHRRHACEQRNLFDMSTISLMKWEDVDMGCIFALTSTIYNKVAMVMKKRIHLTESQFHDIIMEVVRKRDRSKMLARRKMDVIAKTRQMEKFADKITEDVIRKIKDTSFPRFGHNPAVSHLSKRPLKLL